MRIILFYISLFFCISSYSQDSTVFYLIRHAEKDRTDSSNKNPHLNPDGIIRAEKWGEIFEKIELDEIYSSPYYRTQETLAPSALKHDLKITTYEPGKLYSKQWISLCSGKTILIVGHSNTIPQLVNKLIKTNRFKNIPDDQNGLLFRVELGEDSPRVEVFQL